MASPCSNLRNARKWIMDGLKRIFRRRKNEDREAGTTSSEVNSKLTDNTQPKHDPQHQPTENNQHQSPEDPQNQSANDHQHQSTNDPQNQPSDYRQHQPTDDPQHQSTEDTQSPEDAQQTDNTRPAHRAEAQAQSSVEASSQLINATPLAVTKTPEASQKSRATSQSSGINRTTLNTPASSNKLYYDIRDARVEDPNREHHFFIPENAKNAIITKDKIEKELLVTHPNLSEETAGEKAELAHRNAKSLFAILAYMKKGGQVLDFLEEGISDSDLPLDRGTEGGTCKFSLGRKDGGGVVQVLERWESSHEREEFSRNQWLVLAPVFEDMKHYKLHKNHVLPFTVREPGDPVQDQKSNGGYSEVFRAHIHHAHHRFGQAWTRKGENLHVAIKRLYTRDREAFENEQDMLQKLGAKSNPHPHLVRLLASYEVDGEFFLIFPRADCNLRKYWKKHPKPEFDRDTLHWSLKQMQGIATALFTIHNFRVTHPLAVEGIAHTPLRKNAMLRVKPGEELYGRHGDIKPENILWFQHVPYLEHDEGGVLQITDFGLGRFHGRDSKTEPAPHKVIGSPTYEPPECTLQLPVSREYDLWSLGCLYLEFVTWLLKGEAYIKEFSSHRGRPLSSAPGFSDDYFFTVCVGGEKENKYAYVRKGVVTWVQELHADPKCSRFIHDVLDLVMDKLLKVNAKERIETAQLCSCFHSFVHEAFTSAEYLVEPCPRQVRSIKSNPTLQPRKYQKCVRFSREPEIHSLKNFQQIFDQSFPSIDLVSHNKEKSEDLSRRSKSW